MFDELIQDIGGRFALGPKAGDIVRMLIASMTDPETDGLSGFAERFTHAGFGDVVRGWREPTAAPAPALGAAQVDTVLGGPDGLLAGLAARFGLDSATAASVVAFAAPVIMRRLAVDGGWLAVAPSQVESMLAGDAGLGNGPARGAAPRTTGRRGGFLKWLPWLLLVLAAVFFLKRCHEPPTASTAPAPMVVPAVSGAAQPTPAEAIPVGAGALASSIDGQPMLTVYFDSGKADISPAFTERARR